MKPRQHAEKLFQDGVPVNEVADELRLPKVIVEKWIETYRSNKWCRMFNIKFQTCI